MPLSLVFGTAYEGDPATAGTDNIRVYRNDLGTFIGHDTQEMLHVCNHDCAEAVIADEYQRCRDVGPGFGFDANLLASIHPWTDDHGRRWVRTVDVVDFSPGDDPYILCANEACKAELLRNDEAYEAMFGTPIPPRCDNCHELVRIGQGLHSGGYRHDNDEPDAAAEWCETPNGYIRVTVKGDQRSPDAIERI